MSAEDLKRVTDFAVKNGLKIENTNATRRSIVVSGTVNQVGKAFAVKLGRYEHEVARRRGEKPVKEIHHGHDGFIHVPKNLEEVIVGIFGLDNRRISKRNSSGDPPNIQLRV